MNLNNTLQKTLGGGIYYPHKCAYCGKGFTKEHNRQVYCSPQCRDYARREQKARYQCKRRKSIRIGELISNENNFVGTNFLSKHRRTDFMKEHSQILKEMKRLGLR